MKKRERAALLFLLFFIIFNNSSYAQSCVPTNLNGSVIQLSCNNPCLNLSFQVPHLKSTDQYINTSIPYAPFPFDQGTAIPSTYIDDQFSPLIASPFPICFYGQVYNNIVVGSNGVVTFETITANQPNSFVLDNNGVPIPIPNANGSFPAGIFDQYYPRASIFGPYHDIDPSISPLATRRIEYNVFGTAPCRKLVVSFLDIRMFDCDNEIATSQVVISENTGIVEIYIRNKPVCPSWNEGLAIIGIQDETRTKAVSPPGKNCTVFTEANTGYRFTPSGATSRFVSAELLNMAGVVVAVADTSTTTAGLLDISFPNTCPVGNSTQYQVRTTFTSCPIGANLISLDTITVIKNNVLPVTALANNATCGVSNGSITVNVAANAGIPPYLYNINGGLLQASNVFSGLAGGTYTIYATDAFGCDTSFSVTVPVINTLTGTAGSIASSCPGVNNGSITVTPTSGTAPYSYTLNAGTPQASNVFTGLATGTYNVQFTDAFGCTGSVTNINIAQGSGITATATTTATSCLGVNNGSITITPNGGSAPYSYALDGGAPQPGNTITNVSSGPHSVLVTDAAGCTFTANVNVAAGAPLTGTATATSTTCTVATNGTATATPTSGTAPYTYSIDGGAFQNSASFSNLGSGAHTITIRDNNGCTGTVNVTVPVGNGITATATTTATACPGVNSGSISISPSAGTAPYSFALDGGAPQTNSTFTNVSSGAHSILVTDNNGCTFTVNTTVAAGPAITGTSTATATTCSIAGNGTATATPTTGAAPYTYSIDGGAYQNSATFNNLSSGAHIITIRDNNGCTGPVNVSVPVGNGISATATSTGTACPGVDNGTITITPAAGTTPYSYALDGGTPQASNIITGVASGAHSVLVTDANGCTFTVAVSVAQGAALTGTTAANPTCIGFNSGSLTVTPNSGLAPYTYSIDTAASFQNANVFNFLADGNYAIIIRDVAGCTGTTSGTITTAPPVPAFAGNDTVAVTGVPHQLTGSGGVSYLWSPSANLDNPFTATPLATITTDTRFYLQVTDFAGCIGRDTILLKVYNGPTYYVPNAFSPNGDGLNDVFRPIPVGISNTQYFRIFNRYGQPVFETNQYLKGWDGTYKGKQQPIGAYIWMLRGIDRNGQIIEMKGTVMMIQ